MNENLTLSQDIKKTLDESNYDQSKVSIYSNTWFNFIGYFLVRNRGYGFRKIYNLITEVFEIGCLAYLIDTHSLKSLLILPLMNIASGYFQEYYNQLYRGTRNPNFNKIFLLFITLMLAIGLALMTYQQARLHSLFVLLFSFRCVMIFSQTYFNLKNIEFLAFNRLRPNIKAMWLSLFIASAVSAGLIMITMPAVVKIILVSFNFNLARWVPEYLYYKMAQAKIYSIRFISYLKKSPPLSFKTALNEVIFIFVHFSCLIGFSFKFKTFNTANSVALTFLILTFYDRIINRPFKSMSLDLLRLFTSRQHSYSTRLLNRLFLLSLIFYFSSLGTLVWTAKFSKRQIIILAVVFMIFIFHNYLLSVTKFKHINSRNYFLHAYMGLCLANLTLLFSPIYSEYLFIALSTISLLVGSLFVIRGNNYVNDDNRLSYEDKNPLLNKKYLTPYTLSWENFNNQWLNFIEESKKSNNYYIHFNRRIKLFFVRNVAEFERLENLFPLNIEASAIRQKNILFVHPKKIENGQLIYLNELGFWVNRKGQKFIADDATLREINIFNSQWINRHIFNGGRTDLILEKYEFRMAHINGDILWFKPKGVTI
jgi:hypothetical protein